MTRQGWSEGQALGSRHTFPSSDSTANRRHHSGLATEAERLAAAQIKTLFKDDNLGLGAKTRGTDVEGQRTGLDAFQGLLGRLNGKDEGLLRREVVKVEERKLAMFAMGKWGGMRFVRGGILGGSIGQEDEVDENEGDEEERVAAGAEESKDAEEEVHEEKKRRKEAKRQRKEDKRKRKEERALKREARMAKRASTSDDLDSLAHPRSVKRSVPPDEAVSSTPSDEEGIVAVKLTKPMTMKNGRHLLRGRNIQAKKMVLSDMKGLDQIFMR
jgi:Pin2-interacting protein X1